MKCDVVLYGAGSLARCLTFSVATIAASAPIRVAIVGRSREDAEETAWVARGRAAATAQPHRFDTVVANWADQSVAANILQAHRPTVIVVTASEQSPWELASGSNAWVELVKRAGFGLTLPFNASLASQVFRAANAVEPRPFFINACYPDVVNGLLAALGPSDRPIGIGNAAIIESLCRAPLPDGTTVRVVAHHRHLAELAAGDDRDPPLLYIDGERASSAAVAHGLRAIRGRELNWVTGAAASRLLLALVEDRPFLGSLPGPLGETGGYPVAVKHGAIAIDLPPGLSMAVAREINGRAAVREGVMVQEGTAHFSPAARDACSISAIHLPTVSARRVCPRPSTSCASCGNG